MFGPFLVRALLMPSHTQYFARYSIIPFHQSFTLDCDLSLASAYLGPGGYLSMIKFKYEYWYRSPGVALKPIIIHDWNYYSSATKFSRGSEAVQKKVSVQMRMHLK